MGPAFNRMWAASIVSNLADGVLGAAAPLLARAGRGVQLPVQSTCRPVRARARPRRSRQRSACLRRHRPSCRTASRGTSRGLLHWGQALQLSCSFEGFSIWFIFSRRCT